MQNGKNLEKCSTKNLVLKTEEGNFLSLYSDNLTKENLIKGIATIKATFPSLSIEFLSILSDRFIDKGFTDERLKDAINNVIDTCIYPSPTIASFLNFDKKLKLYTYNDILNLIDKGDSFKYYEIKEIDGIKWWIKKQ